uniref:Uncharacterized protein n=1 Tax=Romanomermis culicivorax TaxID=13658 RepID=A0A915KWY6_ROMCU
MSSKVVCGYYTRYKKGHLPTGTIIALSISFIGTIVFCSQTYRGAQEIQKLSDDVFAFLIPLVEKMKIIIIFIGILMIVLTILMSIVGFAATRHYRIIYKNVELADRKNSRYGSRIRTVLANRTACTIFWILSYMLNFCWLILLSITVVLTSAYFAFLPVCLPQTGFETNFCFNFTLFSLMISGGKDPNAVALILCGGPVDKFCKLSKGVMPWFWGSFAGCLLVLMGLSHHNASLSAALAHCQHAKRYRKLHAKYGAKIDSSRVSSSASDANFANNSKSLSLSSLEKRGGDFILQYDRPLVHKKNGNGYLYHQNGSSASVVKLPAIKNGNVQSISIDGNLSKRQKPNGIV